VTEKNTRNHTIWGMTLACALPIELAAAQRIGKAVMVGVACSNRVPSESVLSFGFAGALHGNLPIGTVVAYTRVVDETGRVVWQGEPLGVRDAQPVIALGINRFIGSVAERKALQEKTGADVVDMESGVLAAAGVLLGGIRIISDTPTSRGVFGGAFKMDGTVNWKNLWRSPLKKMSSAADGYKALTALITLPWTI